MHEGEIVSFVGKKEEVLETLSLFQKCEDIDSVVIRQYNTNVVSYKDKTFNIVETDDTAGVIGIVYMTDNDNPTKVFIGYLNEKFTKISDFDKMIFSDSFP